METPDQPFGKISFNTAKASPLALMQPISNEFYLPAGLVALSWGIFEELMHQVLKSFLVQSPDPRDTTGWETKSFSYKRKLLLRASGRLLGDDPPIIKFVHHILGQALELSRKRNTLLHGAISATGTKTETGVVIKLVAASNRQGRHQEYSFTPEELDDFAYEIVRLNGWWAYATGLSVAFAVLENSEIDRLRSIVQRGLTAI